jgi:WD40 repeat protein
MPQHLLSASRDHSVLIWDIESGRSFSRLNKRAFSGTDEGVVGGRGGGGGGYTTSLGFSACGVLALTAGGAREVWLWDLRTNSPVRRLIGGGGGVICAAFSPAGNEVVGGEEDGSLRVWDVLGGQVRHSSLLHSGPVAACRYSGRGTLAHSSTRHT